MPGQIVYQFEAAAVEPPITQANPATVISICQSPEFTRYSPEEGNETNPDGLGCARGIRSAFFLEIGLVLFVYGVWHFWHMLVR